MLLTKFREYIHHLVDGTKSDVVTYALLLEDGCYYIGCTRHLKKRIRNHFSGNGARWCQVHKPIKLIGVVQGDYERELTERARKVKGKEKVRGWKYIRVDEPDRGMGQNLKRLNSFNPLTFITHGKEE